MLQLNKAEINHRLVVSHHIIFDKHGSSSSPTESRGQKPYPLAQCWYVTDFRPSSTNYWPPNASICNCSLFTESRSQKPHPVAQRWFVTYFDILLVTKTINFQMFFVQFIVCYQYNQLINLRCVLVCFNLYLVTSSLLRLEAFRK